MTTRFTERLLAVATGTGGYPQVRPALTPEMIPEVYRLPEGQVEYPAAAPPPVEPSKSVEPETAEEVEEPLRQRPPSDTTGKDGEPAAGGVEKAPGYVTPVGPSSTRREPSQESTGASPQAEGVPDSLDRAGVRATPGMPSGDQPSGAAPKAPITPSTAVPPRLAEREQGHTRREATERTARTRGEPMRKGARTSEERSVTVHIGRIEVRAVLPKEEPRREAEPPALSLEDYLKRRREGTANE